MKYSTSLNHHIILKSFLLFTSFFLSTVCFSEEPTKSGADLNWLYHLHISQGNESRQPILLAWGERSRPEGVGSTRPANAPIWGDGTGTRPEGVGGSRPKWRGDN